MTRQATRRLGAQVLDGAADFADPSSVEHALAAAEASGVTDLMVGRPAAEPAVRAAIAWAERGEMRLWRWHPLLAGDHSASPAEAEQPVGPSGQSVSIPLGSAEFAFWCPCRHGAADESLQRLERAMGDGPWHGVMLDKIRWPSPSPDPGSALACFCSDCAARALREDGLDLSAVATQLRALVATSDGRRKLIELLAGGGAGPVAHFLCWRTGVINDLVERAHDAVAARGLTLALDVFAPSLSLMVGQDVTRLASHAAWTKVMLYAETLAPAGLPFELGALVDWLRDAGDADAAEVVSEAFGFPSLDPDVVFAAELRRSAALPRAWAGLDVVDVAGLCQPTESRLLDRLRAIYAHGLTPLFAWDLLDVPSGRLERMTAHAGRPL